MRGMNGLFRYVGIENATMPDDGSSDYILHLARTSNGKAVLPIYVRAEKGNKLSKWFIPYKGNSSDETLSISIHDNATLRTTTIIDPGIISVWLNNEPVVFTHGSATASWPNDVPSYSIREMALATYLRFMSTMNPVTFTRGKATVSWWDKSSSVRGE
jgi:hypothetical protein